MITLDERRVWPEGPHQEAPSLRDIGVGLARTIRFGGQTLYPYSVLAHSLTVADLLPDELRVYGLLHDAAEVVVGDCVSTWKPQSVEVLEAEIRRRIYRDNGIPLPTADDLLAVKLADETALAAEAHAMGHAQAETWWPLVDYSKRQGFGRAYGMTELRQRFVVSWLTSAESAAAVMVNGVREAVRAISGTDGEE